jgi:hypothetical protein
MFFQVVFSCVQSVPVGIPGRYALSCARPWRVELRITVLIAVW